MLSHQGGSLLSSVFPVFFLRGPAAPVFLSHVSSSLDVCFHTLGVRSGATMEEIQESFHALAKQYHPDRGGATQSGTEKMKRITAAYNQLVTLHLENGALPHSTANTTSSSSSNQEKSPFTTAERDTFSSSKGKNGFQGENLGYSEEAYRRTCEFYRQRQAARKERAAASSNSSSRSSSSSGGSNSSAATYTDQVGSSKNKAWWWLNKFGKAEFALEEFFEWAERDTEFQEWKLRAFRGNGDEMNRVFQVVYHQYFCSGGSSDHGSDWGLEYVQRTFRQNKQICERGMLQYYPCLQDKEILSRVRRQPRAANNGGSVGGAGSDPGGSNT